jgi:crossover junction endodeoxyribonuclease RuvC
MLQRLIPLPVANLKYLDASDALAVAICHHFQGNIPIPSNGKKLKGWEEFMTQNPGRVNRS